MRHRVLHVIDSLGHSGGAEKQLLNNLRHFRDPAFEHVLAHLYIRGNVASFDDQLSGVHRIPLHEEPGTHHGRWSSIRRLRRLVDELEPSLIHCSLTESGLVSRVVSKLTGVPVLETLTNISYEPVRLVDNPAISRIKLGAFRLVEAVSMQSVNRFHAVSHAVADSWAKYGFVPRERMTVIPRGVDLSLLDQEARKGSPREDVRGELGLPQDALVLLMVGRHEPQKGQIYAIRAMGEVRRAEPRAFLVMAGRRGNSSCALEHEIKQLELEGAVRLLGVRRDIPRLMAAADLFLLPSLFEGLPNTLLEAMCSGLPCVAADEPPMREVLQEGKLGILVPPRDPHQLGTVAKRLLSDSRERSCLVRRARDHARSRYRIEEVVGRLEELYDRVIAPCGQ